MAATFKKIEMTRQITLIGSLCLLFFFGYGQPHSLYFSGESEMLQIDASAGNGIRTIQLWFKPDRNYDETNGIPATIFYRDASDQRGEFGLYIGPSSWVGQEGKLVFSRNMDTQRELITSNAASWKAGEWYHVIACIDPIHGMRMYINGTLQTDQNNSTAATDSRLEKVTVGAWGIAGFRTFKGEIDDISVWDRTLTTQETEQFMRRDAVGNLTYSGLLAYWDFNEGKGLTAFDLMGQMDVSVDSSQWRNSGMAMRLDSNQPSIDLSSEVGTGVRSIELWFRPSFKIDENLPNPAALIFRESPNEREEHGLYFGPSNWAGQEGRLVFSIQDQNSGIHRIASDSNSWDPTRWYHVAGVIDPVKGMRLYIDGQIQSDTNTYTQATAALAYPTVMGKWGFREIRYYEGLIDEVRIWQRALSPEEVAAHLCTTSIDGSNLVAYYAFNNAGDSSITDLSANHYDATLSSTTHWEESRNCAVIPEFEMTTSVPRTPLLRQEKLTIQPNPVTTDTQIFFPDHNYREWHWQLFNSLGQLLQQETGNGTVIHFSRTGHSSGVYYFRVTDQATSEEFVEKMIIH